MRRFLLSALIGIGAGVGFDVLFLDLSHHSLLDQFTLIGVSSLAFGYLAHEGANLYKNHPLNFGGIFRLDLRVKIKEIVPFLKEHALGLILAVCFFLLYFVLGMFFNTEELAKIDNLLDADNKDWVFHIAGPKDYPYPMRAPHPFAFFIFRPLGWLTNLIFPNIYLAASFLNSLAGGGAVFLMWLFIKKSSGNRMFASGVAVLLGLSTSHLVFGSIVESYIFSATVMIGFFLLLYVNNRATLSLILVSLLAFGITITNVIQTFIGYFGAHPRGKEIFQFAGRVLSFGIILTLLHVAFYPAAKSFLIPSSTVRDEAYLFSLFHQPDWMIIGRILLILRTILLNSVIAPRPLVLLEEVDGFFPSFQFYRITQNTYLYSDYDGIFANTLLIIWCILLLISGLSLLHRVFRQHIFGLPETLAVCVLFNTILHFFYGEEPFLYSANWTFSLILIVALGIQPWMKHRVLMGLFLAFLILFCYNQWQFIALMINTLKPYAGF